MISCVYDNPNSHARELWVDGELVSSVSFSIFYQKRSTRFKGYVNISVGKIVGDPKAMDKVDKK